MPRESNLSAKQRLFLDALISEEAMGIYAQLCELQDTAIVHWQYTEQQLQAVESIEGL